MKEKNTLATYLIKTKLIHVLISCYTNISFTLFNALLFITFLSLSANLIHDIMKVKVKQILVLVVNLSVSINIKASSSTGSNMNIYSSMFFDS